MKKLLFALALACSLQVAYAQKPDADLQKGVDKALEASKDAKKGAKPATWMNLGKAYWAAYTNPTTSMSTGIDKATFALMNKEKALSVTNVTLQGATFEKQELSHVNVYFNEAGVLAIVEVTHPSVPGDLLGEAATAYVKAFELGAKDKDVDPKLQEVVNAYYNDAFTAYQLGDMAKASDLFKGAADWSAVAPCSVRNDDAAYNCAFTASVASPRRVTFMPPSPNAPLPRPIPLPPRTTWLRVLPSSRTTLPSLPASSTCTSPPTRIPRKLWNCWTRPRRPCRTTPPSIM